MNPYHILNLKPGATEKEITKAYRSLALLHHPDKRRTSTSTKESDEMFQKCKDAYQLLMDPKRRAEVDLRLAGEEERRRRLAEMDENRKRMQRDLLERERAASGKGAGGASRSSSSNQAASSRSTSTTGDNKPANVLTLAKPEYALTLKVKPTGPLPLTTETLGESLSLPADRIHFLSANKVVIEFGDAETAAGMLEALPNGWLREGDWYRGFAPEELFTRVQKAEAEAEAQPKKVKVTREFESSVLQRLREAAAAKKKG